MTKMTIANKYDAVIALLNGEDSDLSRDDAIDFLTDRKDKAQKKAGSRKPTAQQKENEGIKAVILNALTTEGITVTNLINSVPELAGFTNQRVSALLRQLVLDEKVVKTKEGKTTLFAIAE